MAQATGQPLSLVLRDWLGASLRVAIARADRGHFAALPAEERAAVIRAVPARQAEFATARVLARRLLAQLGAPRASLPRQADRAPAWPADIEASITHTEGDCLVVARKRSGLGVGIDWERASRLSRAHWDGVLTQREQEQLSACAQPESVAMQCFSVKESLFKAMQRCGNAGLDFLAVEVSPSASGSAECALHLLDDFSRRLPAGAVVRAWCSALPDGGVISAAEVRA